MSEEIEAPAVKVSVILPTPDKTEPDPQVLAAWEATHPEFEIVVAGANKGRWSRAAAVTEGAAQASGDVLIVCDPDVWPGDMTTAIETASEHGWCLPCRDIDGPAEGESDRRSTRGEVVVLTRDAFETAPPDPRFGVVHTLEADAWLTALGTLVGPSTTLDATALRFGDRKRVATTDAATMLGARYRRAAARADRMRRLVAEI